MLICNDAKKTDGFCNKIQQETYEQYLEVLEKRDAKKDQWVYNILDGTTEQDKVLYRDDEIIILPNYTWDGKDLFKLHVLTFPFDRSLRSIRSLDGSHINLLIHCRDNTLKIIEQVYGYQQEQIKMFLHYTPTTYHLHIHFMLITNTAANSSVEYSHELSNVIYNLSIKSDYYKTIVMNKRT